MDGCCNKWIFNIPLLVIIILMMVPSQGSIILDKESGLEQNGVGEESFVVSVDVSRRKKRYALEGSRWRVNEITYRISKYSDKLPKETVDNVIKKAFSIWSKVTNLKFTKKKAGKVHIDIKFERGDHGDGAGFDGPGGQRAHAFFPGYGGDAHFDDDENWTLGQVASKEGSRLLLVATHELGHALGLGHSEKESALMAPSHEEWKGEVRLDEDDIQAIQALYGAPGEDKPQEGDPAIGRGPGPNGQRRPGGPGGPGGPRIPGGPGGFPFGPQQHPAFPGGPPPHLGPPTRDQGPVFVPQESPPPPIVVNARPSPRRRPSTTASPTRDYDIDYDYTDNNDNESEFFDDPDSIIENSIEEFSEDDFDNKQLCSGDIDTILTMKNDETYVFKGGDYWKLTDTSVAAGYPRTIRDDWEGLPGNLDAAFTWTNGKMYFFKGNRYWRFSPDKSLDKGFPKKISDGFEGIPNNVDAAFVWSRNDKIYFFQGSQYFKFDPKKKTPVDESYPRPIENWDGIPDNVDAALQYSNGNTYFFRAREYYRFDEETFAVDTRGPAYPRNTGEWWFGCSQDRPRKLKRRNKNDRKFILD